MQYVAFILAGILALAVLIIVTALYSLWEIRLHIKDKYVKVEIRNFFFRKTVIDGSKEKKTPSSSSVGKTSEKTDSKENKIKDRLKEDKKRIYDPEKGGFQKDGFDAVISEYLSLLRDVKGVVRDFLGALRYKIEIPMLNIRLDIGTDNPAHTGMIYSSVWNAAGIFYPILSQYFRMAYPTIELTPDFYGQRFNLEIKSIIKVRPAHIINASLKQCMRMGITYVKKYFTKGSVKDV